MTPGSTVRMLSAIGQAPEVPIAASNWALTAATGSAPSTVLSLPSLPECSISGSVSAR